MQLGITTVLVFVVAVLMTMSGRGGGTFYVPILVATGESMHRAAASGQLILLLTAAAGMLVFQKHRVVDWKLALVIDPPTDIMAFFGGYLSGYVDGTLLKFVLAGLLILAGCSMLIPVKDRQSPKKKGLGFWTRRFGGREYVVNLWLAIPITAATGLAAGAVGMSGGSFKVPLMVLACGVPMPIAVGTSSVMVAATALMGFAGHMAGGDFHPQWALPLACAATMGGLIGGRFAMRTTPARLKTIFAVTTLAAGLFMIGNAWVSCS